MKKVVAILLAAIMIMSFAACGGSKTETPANTDSSNTESTAQTTQPEDTSDTQTDDAQQPPAPVEENTVASDESLVIAVKGNPTGLFTLGVSAVSVNAPTMCSLYDRLVYWNASTREIEPMLATSWEYVDDTHVRFHLRDDVVSHAGDPFTASDVIYTVTTGQESGLLANYFGMFNLTECKVEDDYTVILATTNPEPYFLETLSNTPLAMVVQASVERDGGIDGQILNPTSATGPYKFVEWSDGAYIKLERNENYWGPTPYYKDVELRIITDASSRVMNLESHDVNVAFDPDTTAISLLDGNPDFQIINLPTSNISTLTLNCSKAPFDDPNVRKAVALAIDYESDLNIAVSVYGETTDTFLPKASSAYVSPAEGSFETNQHYDLEAAKAALAESAYPNGFEFTIIYAENPTWQAYGELLQNQLGQLGVKVNLKSEASSVFYEDCSAGNFDAHLVNAANPDPAIQLRYYDPRIDVATMRGGSIYTGASDELLALFDQAKIELDDAKSKQIYTQIAAMLGAETPIIPLYSPNLVIGADANIKGITITVFGAYDFSRAYAE